jgi:hypothetical protein
MYHGATGPCLFFHHCSYDGLRSDTCTGGYSVAEAAPQRLLRTEQCAGQDTEIFKRGEILQLERRYRVETLNMPYVQRLALSHRQSDAGMPTTPVTLEMSIRIRTTICLKSIHTYTLSDSQVAVDTCYRLLRSQRCPS